MQRPSSLLWAALVGAALACTPGSHRLAPYRDDPEAAAQVESQAAARCSAERAHSGLPVALPPNPFTTDGCSSWPDDGWVDCCVDHDLAYWCGGTSEQRDLADAQLRECVARDHAGSLAGSMYWGVRLGGSAWWPLPWRWGYGWPWPHGYEDPPVEPSPEG